MSQDKFILADGRWYGAHGIGRFSQEIISRLQHTDILTEGPAPLSLKNLYWLPQQLAKYKQQYRVYFSPGFMPPVQSAIPFVFTLHDLIHLHGPDSRNLRQKIFYHAVIKPAAKRAQKIITVSEFSKQAIMAWANIPAEKIVVVKNGISRSFTPNGKKHQPGYPYFFYVGNTKPHKNVPRLIQAFANAKIDPAIKLILTGAPTPELTLLIKQHKIEGRLIFTGALTESALAEHYRGAISLLFPSLYEGFGLPVVEAMASGTPVITSNVTSLPEVAGNAAIMINPLDCDALTFNIEQLMANDALRTNLIIKGLQQATEFSWEQSAHTIQRILSTI
jgi:glycosyltransferase involved in cell wall biosynthesis